jgi:hypothetical protein
MRIRTKLPMLLLVLAMGVNVLAPEATFAQPRQLGTAGCRVDGGRNGAGASSSSDSGDPLGQIGGPSSMDCTDGSDPHLMDGYKPNT